jgi:nucleoside-diphosphate-sugar epimerase
VISSTIRQALDPSCSTINVGDITTVRDFNYVSDTVTAFMTLGEANKVELGAAYNAATGVGVTIGEMIDVVRAATGTNKPTKTEASRLRPDKSEVRALIADARLFTAATGWTPKTDLAAGIGLTVAWWRERFKRGAVRADAGYVL